MTWETLKSKDDASVNHAQKTPINGAMWEARYVQRTSDYFIAYVSSHAGCNQSCRFCHLTATGQTSMLAASMDQYLEQISQVIQTYKRNRENGLPPAQRAHINFMARGEPLLNPTVREKSKELYERMAHLMLLAGIEECRFKVSSIIPRDFEGGSRSLEKALQHPNAMLYYSLYSLCPRFRKRWLPKAMAPEKSLDILAEYQQRTGKEIAFHWAFIEGENDRDEDIDALVEAIKTRHLKGKFNLVRYNPYSPSQGNEPSEDKLQSLFTQLSNGLGHQESRIVPRVGFDIKASCGMFINDNPR